MRKIDRITIQQANNLRKLADLLKSTVLKINMSTYVCGDDIHERFAHYEKDYRDDEIVCNTVACAIGWAPMVVPVPEDCKWGDGAIHYGLYADAVFGCERNPETVGFEIFQNLFGFQWTEIDNTRLGAAFRIETFLETGEMPDYISIEAMKKDEEWINVYFAHKAEWEKSNEGAIQR